MRVDLLVAEGLLLAAVLGAQGPAPVGIVRGTFVSFDGTPVRGDMQVRTADDHVYQCSYDARTFFDRDNQRISIPGIAHGERVELVADRPDGPDTCYARTVHVVLTPPAKPLPGGRPALTPPYSPTETFAPRGDMTFTGIVMKLTPDEVTIRTRSNGMKTIVLRRDTRYIGEGFRVNPDALAINTRVFIRAGHNYLNQVEAYQIVWGEMLTPGK